MNNFTLDIPRMGYIILIKNSGDFIGNQIEKIQLKAGLSAQESEYTHCAVSGGGQWIVEVSWPKTETIDIRKKYNGKYIKILRYNNEEYERKGRYKIAFWSATQCNLKYDLFGALAFKIKLFWQWPSRQFCSENALWAFKKEYPDISKLEPSKCLPAHFLTFNDMETAWEGTIE